MQLSPEEMEVIKMMRQGGAEEAPKDYNIRGNVLSAVKNLLAAAKLSHNDTVRQRAYELSNEIERGNVDDFTDEQLQMVLNEGYMALKMDEGLAPEYQLLAETATQYNQGMDDTELLKETQEELKQRQSDFTTVEEQIVINENTGTKFVKRVDANGVATLEPYEDPGADETLDALKAELDNSFVESGGQSQDFFEGMREV